MHDENRTGLPPGIPASIEAKILEIVDRIAGRFKPDQIIMFGSFALGSFGPDSDLDLLVVMRVSGSKRDQAAMIHAELAGIGLPKDIVVVTPEEFERYRDVVGTIVYPAAREGRILYDRAA